MMYASGVRANVGKFSQEKVGEMVDDYVANATRLSDRRWRRIIGVCGAESENDGNAQHPPPSTPSMQNKRRVLYFASSPMRED
jgi:hypothetical protein